MLPHLLTLCSIQIFLSTLLEWYGTIRINNERSHRTVSSLTNAMVLVINELQFVIPSSVKLLIPLNRKMLMTGEKNNTNYLNTNGLYDPVTDIWTSTSRMNYIQRLQLASESMDRKVLVC